MRKLRFLHILRILFSFLSVFLVLLLSYCYFIRPDFFAAITVFPTWMWFIPGLALTAFLWSKNKKRIFVLNISLWLLFLLVCAEEPTSLLRSLSPAAIKTQPAVKPPNTLRVVSLNCAGGSEEAADEVTQYNPDIVLLQENPGRETVEKLASKLFAKDACVVWGFDPAIITRGKCSRSIIRLARIQQFLENPGRLELIGL